MNLDWKHFLVIAISFLIGIYGVFLTKNAYYKKLGTIAILSEINFLKEMPFLLSKEKLNILPIGHENLILKNNKDFSLKTEVLYFNNKNSIYDIKFILNYKEKEILNLYCLIDARIRK